jgi:aspartyl-tRNA synthetase
MRTHYCGDLSAALVGQTVTLAGWAHRRRDHGGVIFIDLRDREGLAQVVCDPDRPAAFQAADRSRNEYVLRVTGTVRRRPEGTANPNLRSGEVEVLAHEVEVLNPSVSPPFQLDDDNLSENTRLAYRVLDLRREPMQRNMRLRHRVAMAVRKHLDAHGFLDIETPMLTRSTPEGARDYLVPSRVHPGEFFALPQSPQIFKQLLMVAGFDRYYQIVRCFRDEDLRADRQPEFTQLDMEMSFVEEEEVFATWEAVLQATFRDAMGIEIAAPFPRLRWSEAMERYGVDKPDLRFGLELASLDTWARECEFQVFRGAVEGGGRVLALVVPAAHELSRKDVAALEDAAKGLGAKGLAWWKCEPAGGSGPLARFVAAPGAAAALMHVLGAHPGDTALFVADQEATARKVMGELRNQLGRKLGLIPSEPQWRFTWVTRFPLFEYDPDAKRWFAAHHPFTAPEDWSLGGPNPDLGSLSSRAYDLVLNGWELGSGSVRIHRADVQQKVFETLGIGPEEQQKKFGFLLEALAQGAPPHAGFALGLDRTIALTLGLDNIREVIAFPKTASAADLMCGAPSPVDPEQLREVHIALAAPPARA